VAVHLVTEWIWGYHGALEPVKLMGPIGIIQRTMSLDDECMVAFFVCYECMSLAASVGDSELVRKSASTDILTTVEQFYAVLSALGW
jgi:hypothetical protein